VDEVDIPTLHERLSTIVDGGKLGSMQKTLACAAQHLVYSSITGGILGDEGKYDAFETTLEVLRAMHDHPGAPPDQLQNLDPDFRLFMHCGVTEGPFAGDGQELNTTIGEASIEAHVPRSEEWIKESKPLINFPQPLTIPLGLRRRVPAKPPTNYSYGLCSHSLVDEHQGGLRPSCSDCLMGSSNTHGIPGGAACCGSRGRLERCLRFWE